MNYKNHTGKLKRFSKWGFSGSEDKPDLYSTQDSVPQLAEEPYSLDSDGSYYLSSPKHQSSSPLDRYSRAMDLGKASKSGTPPHNRPVSDYISPARNSPASQPDSARFSLPHLSPGSFPQIPSLSTPSSPQWEQENSQLISSDSLLNTADQLLLQMLIAKSVSDCEPYGILSLQQLDDLKKEEEAVKSHVLALTTKHALESKVKEGAQALIRLHSANKKTVNQAQDQLFVAQHKLDDISKDLWNAQHRWWEIQCTLKEHHAAVLRVAYQRQEKETTRLTNNLKLREGQVAVADGSFLNSMEHSVNSSAPSSRHQILQSCLDDALSADPKSQDPSPAVSRGPSKRETYNTIAVENLQRELEESKKHIVKLEYQLANSTSIQPSLSDPPSLVNSEAICSRTAESEIEKDINHEEFHLLKEEHLQLLQRLESLFNEIPESDHETNSSAFSVDVFIQRVDGLVDENNELLDRILALQKLHLGPNPEEVMQLKNHIMELNASLTESQSLITSLESKLDVANSNDHSQDTSVTADTSTPARSPSRNTSVRFARGTTLHAELAVIVEELGQITERARLYHVEHAAIVSERDQLRAQVESAEVTQAQLQAELDLKFEGESCESRRAMRVEFRERLRAALIRYRQEVTSLSTQNKNLQVQLRTAISRHPPSSAPLVS